MSKNKKKINYQRNRRSREVENIKFLVFFVSIYISVKYFIVINKTTQVFNWIHKIKKTKDNII